jgi:hypothetical protein
MSGVTQVLLGLESTDLVDFPATLEASDVNSGSAAASISVKSDGTLDGTGAQAAPSGTWLNVGAASDYEIYVTGTGDTPTGAAVDTWLGLGTTRQWALNASSILKDFLGTFSVRRVADSVVVDSGTFHIEADGTP